MSDQYNITAGTFQILGSMSDPDSLRRAILALAQSTNTAINAVNGLASAPVLPPTSVHSYSNTTGITLMFQDPAALKYIIRSGPTANFTDTTDTAANIVAGMRVALPNANLAGFTWTTRYINTTGFVQTIAGGAGVTLVGQPLNASFSFRDYIFQITNANAGTEAVTVTSVGSGGL